MERPRRETRPVQVGDVQIGGDAPVSVQSMTTTKTHEVETTLDEIDRLAEAGADVVRVAVPRPEDADALGDIVQGAPVPIVADIHFNYQYALKAIDAGIHKVRINPGNIGKPEWEREVLHAAKDAGIPIRIGVNSGSLEEDILEKHGYPKPEALYESAMRHVEVCHKNDFEDIVISVKHSDPYMMIQAYRKVAEETEYPLHLGVTESGTLDTGTVKSSIGIGSLLADGIGDTIRVSLAADPVEEVKVGHRILSSLGIGRPGVNIIACPTCGRLVGDLFTIVEEVEEAVAERSFDKDLNVALMGCAVNGPGEASGADLGVSLGRGRAHFFKHGEVVDTIPEDEIVDRVLEAIDNWDEDDEAMANGEADAAPSGDGAPTDEDEETDATSVTKPDLPTS
jgi:(E)-4-hydroxy-3-methylbut-2-enyl-diphosphate synthase